jgi:hypothetical protein
MNTVIALLMILLFQAAALGQGYTFRTLPHLQDEDQTDLNSDGGLSITNAGTILMSYIPLGAYYRTLEIFPDGTVKPIKTPATAWTINLNERGEIGGTGYDGKGCEQPGKGKSLGRSIHPHRPSNCDSVSGFVIWQNGSIKTYTIPGKWINGGGTVNDYGHRVVSVRDRINTDYFSGALLGKTDRNPIILDYPGAAWTWAIALNNSDDVVGGWYDGAGPDQHGYLWSKGKFYSIDVPGAVGTSPTSINNLGDIGGMYWNMKCADDANIDCYDYHAFIYSHGAFTTIDFPVPDGVERIWTAIGGVNDKGDIAGTYLIVNPALLNGLERFAFVATAN